MHGSSDFFELAEKILHDKINELIEKRKKKRIDFKII